MSTVRDLIHASCRLIKAVDSTEAMEAKAAQDGLETLNDLIQSLNMERLVNEIQALACTTTPGKNPHTIGLTGDFAIAQPVEIDHATITISGLDYPLEILESDTYAQISDKTGQGQPTALFFLPGTATGTVYLNPVPDAAYALNLWSWGALPTYSSINDTMTLRPGYRKALKYLLAVELAPEYGKAPDPILIGMAQEAKAQLKRMNAITPQLVPDTSLERGTGAQQGFLAGW
jgi:hypothetical protein